MVKEFFREFGLEVPVVFAGIAGALASITKEKELTRWQRLTTVLVGGAVAGYCTPILSNMINMGEQVTYGLGFVLGYSGLRFVEMLIDKYIKKPKDAKKEQN